MEKAKTTKKISLFVQGWILAYCYQVDFHPCLLFVSLENVCYMINIRFLLSKKILYIFSDGL